MSHAHTPPAASSSTAAIPIAIPAPDFFGAGCAGTGGAAAAAGPAATGGGTGSGTGAQSYFQSSDDLSNVLSMLSSSDAFAAPDETLPVSLFAATLDQTGPVTITSADRSTGLLSHIGASAVTGAGAVTGAKAATGAGAAGGTGSGTAANGMVTGAGAAGGAAAGASTFMNWV